MPHSIPETSVAETVPPPPSKRAAPRYSDTRARELWTHEDHLINARVQWLCVTQGLLFAAYGLSFQLPESVVKGSAQFKEFITVVPAAGAWISLLAFVGILSAFFAMALIYRGSPWDRPGVSLTTTIGGAACALGIPIMFGAIWLKVMQLSVSGFFFATTQYGRSSVSERCARAGQG